MFSQAFFTGIQGGDPLVGFASGALSSVASSLYGGSGYTKGGKFVQQTQGLNGIIGGGDIGMVAFGTVAGGAGASLTGGNFWQGAATGLVVSGLNHLAHRVVSKIQFNKTLKEMLTDVGINPDDVPLYQVEEAKCVIERCFSEMYKEAKFPEITNGVLNNANGRLEAYLELKNGKYINHSKTSKIILSDKAYKSYMQLATTIGHELTHAIDYAKGNYAMWRNSSGGEAYRKAMAEINAYGWERNVNSPLFNKKMYDTYYGQIYGN